MTGQHIPVLLEEAVAGLGVFPGGRYVDATVGAGGHASRILALSAPDGQCLGLDADPAAIERARDRLEHFGQRCVLAVANFRRLKEVATSLGFGRVDGILMDLGLSSVQLAAADRGFSFNRDGPLDMRLNPTRGETVADLVNRLPEAELANLIYRYGEERRSRRIARAIVAARPLRTTGHLAAVVRHAAGRRGRIDAATRTFQALRIAVNDELGALEAALPQAGELLRPGGRLAVISFHSLEDRLVKRYYQKEARDCWCPPEAPVCVCDHMATLRIVTRKPLRPAEDELAHNPRSRSARLRIAERLDRTTSSRQTAE